MIDTEEKALREWFTGKLITFDMDILSFLRRSGVLTEPREPIFA